MVVCLFKVMPSRRLFGLYLYNNSRIGAWCREKYGEDGGAVVYNGIIFVLAIGVTLLSIPLGFMAVLSPVFLGIPLVVIMLGLSWWFMGMTLRFAIGVGVGSISTTVGLISLNFRLQTDMVPIWFPVFFLGAGVVLFAGFYVTRPIEGECE